MPTYISKENKSKLVILTFVGNYLPGFKAGGILRSLVNVIDYLCDIFEFWIVTRDRDLGDNKPYSDIKVNQWQQVGNAMVYYLPPHLSTVNNIHDIIVSTPHNVLYLNSFFDPLTIKVLLNRKYRRDTFKPVIVAPLGEFAWASLKQKYYKKYIFIQVAIYLGLYKNVTWRASSEFEMLDIINVMKIKHEAIHIASDLPNKIISGEPPSVISNPFSEGKSLRIVFLSRISREKNLDYALRVLSKVNAMVLFDIYGPLENSKYWKECQELICKLPANIKVKYLGSVNPNQVGNIFSCYDLFLFPTAGENYGHVIAESLSSGTPVLISTETPWRNLQADELGWDINIEHIKLFVEKIEEFALISNMERLKKRSIIKANIMKRLFDPAVFEANRQLFLRSNASDSNI